MITLPNAFIERTKILLGTEFSAFLEGLNTSSPVSIRVNNKLESVPSKDRVLWCKDGYYLPERPLFTADPLLHAGAYYVQEASSMFLDVIARKYLSDADKVLDLCAAPGGKSTLLANALKSDALLVSNEILPLRANILAENIIKWGKAEIVVTNNSPYDFGKLSGYFDAIIIDAPCSGEGMFRKDPKAISEWSVANIKNCVMRQRDIVNSAWNSLKKGGILIYSTCTFNREENEENVHWICNELGAQLLRPDISEYKDITESDAGLRFYPHKIRGEGFFISVMQKTSECKSVKINKTSKNKGTNFVNINEFPAVQLKNAGKYQYLRIENNLYAFAMKFFEDFLMFLSNYKCLECGIHSGEFKGKDFIPTHRLALCNEYQADVSIQAEVNIETALKYLKREALFLPDAPTGYILISYNNQVLGWAKNLGNRCNNLYPLNWKIRMNL